MINIPVSDSVVGKEEEKNIIECIKNGWISKGKYIQLFEEEFARYVGTKYAVSCNTGTSALHLALLSSGIEKGDEIILPSMTFAATAFVASYCNAKPIFIDSDQNNWCINTNEIIEEITQNTKAIISVDLFGHPADFDTLIEIAEDYNLILISDSAESLGSEYKEKRTGTFGDCSCFSFYGNKIITCGEGGMLVTDNKKIAEEAISYRNNCMIYPYYHNKIGYNYRLDNIRASIGYTQLMKIDKFLEIKRNNAKTYISMLKNNPNVKIQKEEDWAKSNYWMFSILIDSKPIHEISNKLRKFGIDTRPFFTPMHTLPSYLSYNRYNCPISEMLFNKGLILPSGCTLEKDNIIYIVNKLNDILENKDER